MRASRFAPLCACSSLAAATAVAVLTSRAEDWDRPLIIVLVACAGADRRPLRGPDQRRHDGGGHPPGLRAGHDVARARPRCWSSASSSIFGNRRQDAAGSSATRRSTAPSSRSARCWAAWSREHLGVATSSAWFALAVIGVFLLTWALNVVLVGGYMRWLEGMRIDRELAATWRPLVSAHIALACATAVLVYLVATVGAAVIALSGVILIAYSRLQRDLLQAERHAEAARQAATARPGAARRPRADHPRLPRRPRPHDRAPLRRRRPLHAADRRGRRVPGVRAAPGPHRRALPRRRQGHVRRPDVPGRQAHGRGVGDRQAPSRARGGARRPSARPRGRGRDHPLPPRAHRRPRLSARPRRRRHPTPVAHDLDRRHLRRDDRAATPTASR